MIALLTANANAEPSFFEKLGATLYELFFVNKTYYANLKIDAQDYKVLMISIIAFCIGIILAGVAAVFNKRVLGGFVRTCLQKEALSPERAMTLSELGFEKRPILRHAVRSGVNLRRVVRCREEEEYLAELEKQKEAYENEKKSGVFFRKRFREKPYKGRDTDHYYIPEDLKYMADAKFEAKGTSWVGIVILTVLVIIALFLLARFLPNILQLLDGFVKTVGGEKSNKVV